MSLAKVYIAAFLLASGIFCHAETSGTRKLKVNDSDSAERVIINDAADDVENSEQEQDSTEKIMPILPPIILLDFDNGTISDDTNATVDEKSKRTVNNNLGYGFERNVLHAPRKYNYYFPAGKTGTTVTIEESISPFLPRTIIEKVPPSTDRKPVADLRSQSGSYGTRDSTRSNSQSSTSYQYYNPATISQPVFGLRTKLTKTSEPYRGFSPSARPPIDTYPNVDYRESAYTSTTPQSLNSAETETDYVTPSPQSYTASSSSQYVYVTPSPPSYDEINSQRYLGQSSQHAINVQDYPRSSAQSSVESSTANPYLGTIDVRSKVNSHDYVRPTSVESSTSASSYAENAGSFANMPKYTVENGVRYENKVFWKYPDGRVSDVPPMTYETYSDYPSLDALQAARSQDTSQTDESSSDSMDTSVLSQAPMQFPISPGPNGSPNPFISAESGLPHQQTYRLSYQNLVGQKQIGPTQQARIGSGVSATYSATSSQLRNSNGKSNRKSQKNRYEQTSRRPTSKYMVNSPNAEYVESYTTESTPRSTTPSRAFMSSAGRHSAKKTNVNNKNLENYSNLQYGDLLNYNPSISQYIKNPSSILNVRPTFVQAGDSLIPVIILRVDGVPPIQSNASPNVNLKALLQQYLLQYARSIEELARPTNYDFDSNQLPKDQHPFSTNSLRKLAQLIQNSNDQDQDPNPTESYVGRSSYETSNLDVEKSLSSVKYGERTAIRPKVKSVQIVEDPRFGNYRIKN
ncbi:cell wall protein RBR3-like [Nylanderia fulva]|uniref:cell wall protein RBR3-like n=1 Tax=Nylanderia fulva TaxID=613905 RepID=UPI0010FB1425|nr:cell wall protein RBR3-like [Nylanderia fulva]